jgi:hypothetical protein
MLVSALVVLAASPSWEATFTPGATASYLDRPNLAVVVVAGGPTSPSTQDAASAIAQALRTSQRTRFVMTGEGLSVQPTDPDVRIVQQSAALPVDLVLIVRTFPGPTETAVALLYSKEGAAVASMAGTLGQPLASRGASALPPPPSPAPVAMLPPAPPPPPPPVMVESPKPVAGFAPVDLRITPSKKDPDVLMQRGRALEAGDLYEVTGRLDLKRQYATRVTTKVLSIIGGAALLVAGAITLLVGLNDRCAIFDASTFTCLRRQTIAQPTILAAALGAVGAGGVIFGLAFPAHPMSQDERKELVDRYNKSLDAPQSAAPEGPTLKFALGVVPTGGLSGMLRVEF